jgi:dienelactone hydrolase
LELDPQAEYAFAVYNPTTGEIPLPNDALRDDDTGTLNLSTTREGLTATAIALREWINTLDGWGTTTPAKVRFSHPLDPETLLSDTIRVYEWGNQPVRLDVTIELDDAGERLTITPPREGWKRGGRYTVVVQGGEHGVRTLGGLTVGPDTAFYYLRLRERLDTYANQRAFSGATREERMATAARLERIRSRLDPVFTHLETMSPEYLRIPREDIAALWDFTVTQRVELVMDAPSGRMPLPFDLLIDPNTGLVDLPASEWDTDLEADAKRQLSKLNGFALSANLSFETTGPIDPFTATPDAIELWDLAQTPTRVPIARIRVFATAGEEPCAAPVDDDCRYVQIEPEHASLPLRGASTYAIVVRNTLLDSDREPIEPMLIGRLLRGEHPVAIDSRSTLGSVDDETAIRLEGVRVKLDALLDLRGRDDVLAAWPFTTMDAIPAIAASVRAAETLGIDPTPTIDSRMPAYAVLGEHALQDLFPGTLNPGHEVYLGRTLGVAEVIQGTIRTPYFLDPTTRRWNEDGSHEVREVNYLATVPIGAALGEPLPVVIFGHAVVTDRRFLLTIAGRLAREGFAAVAIDFPFHGERVECVDASLIATPNFLPPSLRTLTGLEDDLLYFPPCESGADATCGPNGECLDADGNIEDFTTFPIIDMKPVSGAALLDMADLPHIPDRFSQSVVDLGALRHSLQAADWSEVFGRPVDTDTLYFAGQSLGSLIGSVFVALEPSIDRAVFNVPGSDLVALFRDSTYFGPQINAFMANNDIEVGSWDEARLLDTARWLVDSIDPQTVAHLYRDPARPALLQIDRVSDGLGDLIIPNHTSDTLARVSGLPSIDYPSVLHADLVIPVLGNAMLDDMADFLSGDLQP